MSYRRDVEDRMENPNLLHDLGINKSLSVVEPAGQAVVIRALTMARHALVNLRINKSAESLALANALDEALAASQAEPTELLRAMVGWYSTHGTLHHSDVMGKAKAFLAKEK